jgi:hypothetical protein
MKSSVGFLAGLTIAFSLGCGQSNSEKFVDTFCGEFAKCCAQAGLPSNGNFCHLMMSGGSYNSQAGDACLAEMKSQVAAGTFCASQDSSSVCQSVFSSPGGGKKPGEDCNIDSDCAPSSNGKVVCASLYVNSAFIHKCQVQVQGKVGDTPCAGTKDGDFFLSSGGETDIAPSAIVCNTADGVQCKSGTCVALAAVGATCGSTLDCVRSAFCPVSAGKCAVRVAAGSACASGDDDECLDGNYCASGTKMCTAKGANGAACTTMNMCQSNNCPVNTCESNGLDTFGLALLCGS